MSSPAQAPVSDLSEQAIQWFVRLHSDEMAESELYAFADWLAEDHKHSEAFAATEKLFSEMISSEMNLKQPTNSASEANVTPSAKPKPARIQKSWLVSGLAMAAAWLVAILLILPQDSQFVTDYLADATTHTGEIRDLVLADGSHVLLNTNSAISTEFSSTKRQITLHHGQALFTVAADVKRPFEVTAGHLITTALGTVFEVYKLGQAEVSVTVQEHAVSARMDDSRNSELATIINTGQQLNYRTGDVTLAPKSIDLEQAKAWQQQRLMFSDQPLSELVAELNRYRTGRIFLSDNNLKNLRVTGVFSVNNPDQVLTKVCQILNLKQTHLGAWWVLLHR